MQAKKSSQCFSQTGLLLCAPIYLSFLPELERRRKCAPNDSKIPLERLGRVKTSKILDIRAKS
jgi:hypothetical protein